VSNIVPYDFHGDRLEVIERDGQFFAALRPMCEALGIDVDSQRKKLREKPWAVAVFITATGSDGKKYEMLGLHLDSVPMWLATIEPARVAEAMRGKLLRYQLECARVLRDHFLGRREAPPQPASTPTLPAPATAAVQARIGDDVRAKAVVRALCSTAANVSGRSVQSVQGEIRRPWGVASIYRVPLVALDHTLKSLESLIAAPRQLSVHERQPPLFRH
jgi:hypothetical protein